MTASASATVKRSGRRRSGTIRVPSQGKVSVVHIVTDLSVGGAAETAIAICALLPKEEFEVTLLTGMSRAHTDLRGYASQRDVATRIIPALRRPVSPLRDLVALIQLWSFLRRRRPDVVQTHSSKPGVLGRVAAWAAGVPVVIHTVHGWSFHVGQRRPIKWAVRMLERVLATVSSVLVVVSREDERIGASAGIGTSSKYRVIRSGVDLERFSPGVPKAVGLRERFGLGNDAVIVGSIGRLEAQKDPLLFVEAAAIIAESMPSAEFMMVGDGSLKDEVRSRARERHLSAHLHLLGTRRDIPDLLPMMDVLVMTSRWEGLPRVIVEAMAARTPVISTSVGGTCEVIEHGRTGLLVAPGDAQAIAQATIQMVTSPGLAQRLATAAAAEVDEFSEDRMAAATAQLYRDLLQGAESHAPSSC